MMPAHGNVTTQRATEDLILAVRRRKVDDAMRAINAGADVNCRVNRGFKIASADELQQNLSSTVRGKEYLVPMHGTTTLLNIVATIGMLPEGMARVIPTVTTQLIPIARLLMDNGADLGAIDHQSFWGGLHVDYGGGAETYFQNTPLLNAIAANNIDFAMLYMDYVQQLPLASRQTILNYKDKFFEGFHTALEFAIRRGYTGLAEKIVRAGADLNPIPFLFSCNQSPLHMACMLLGNSWGRTAWNVRLGSDVALILALIEEGADIMYVADTQVYDLPTSQCTMKFYSRSKQITPFDHIPISVQEETERVVDMIDACTSNCFKPQKLGQVKHPFEAEACFMSPLAEQQRANRAREIYLQSTQYETDKILIQKALLKRIIALYQSQHPGDTSLNNFNVDQNDVFESIALLIDHPQYKYFARCLQYTSLVYNADKERCFPRPATNSHQFFSDGFSTHTAEFGGSGCSMTF